MNSTLSVVLVVEDEPLLLMAAADMAEDAGYSALMASDADGALLLLEARDDIRLVFTDIDMPGAMNGLALAARVHGRWPDISLIVTSGNGSPSTKDLPEGSLFFSKPYVDRHVAAAMRRLTA